MIANNQTYISRSLEAKLTELAEGYPVLVLTGPRQSGKTTLARKLFHDRPYIFLNHSSLLKYINTIAINIAQPLFIFGVTIRELKSI